MALTEFSENEIVSRINVNQRISEINGTVLYIASSYVPQVSITLNDDWDNYYRILTFFQDDNYNNSSVYFYTNSYSHLVNMTTSYRDTLNNKFICNSASMEFDRNNMNVANIFDNGRYLITDSSSTNNLWEDATYNNESSNIGIVVTKIIGYKY